VAALADDIAYNNHDLDDGLRSKLVPIAKIRQVPLVARFIAQVEAQHGTLPDSRLIYEVNRRLITEMVHSLVQETGSRLRAMQPQSPDAIRDAGYPVAAFSETLTREIAELRAFLFEEFYLHPHIKEIMEGAQKIVRDLHGHFCAHTEELPEDWQEQVKRGEKGRVIGDFVAGMTDRLAMEWHGRLFDDTPRLR
jgi:dGTPase